MFTCDHSLIGFPVAFFGNVSWKCAQRCSLALFFLLCWMSAGPDTGAMSGKVAHLRDSISPVLLPNCSQGACLCLGAPLLQTSQCHLAFPSVSSLLPPALWPVGGVDGCVVVLVPRLALCSVIVCSLGEAQPNWLLCSLLVRKMSRLVPRSVGLRGRASCRMLGIMSYWISGCWVEGFASLWWIALETVTGFGWMVLRIVRPDTVGKVGAGAHTHA